MISTLAINSRIILIHKHEPDLRRVKTQRRDIYESEFVEEEWLGSFCFVHLEFGFIESDFRH
jgi:hypothetical protein